MKSEVIPALASTRAESDISMLSQGTSLRPDSMASTSTHADESNFILTTLDSQIRLLVDSIDQHASFAIESSKSGKSVDRNVILLNNMRGTLSRQALATRNTIRYLENRLNDQMHQFRSSIVSNLEREETLRQRLQELQTEATNRGVDLTRSAPRESIETNSPLDPSSFEQDLEELISVRDRLLRNIEQVDTASELRNTS